MFGVSTAKVTTPMRKNVFRTGAIPDDLQAKAVVDYDIHNLKARNIAILHDTSEYGKGGADGIVERLAEYGLNPVARESYAMGDTDFTPQILKLREAKPEVVHLYAYPKEAAIIARQAKELGLGAQIIGSAAVSVPAFLESAGDAATGVLSVYPFPKLADSPAPEVVDFINRLKANYRVGAGRPAYVDLEGYGAGKVVVEALKRAGKDLTWEKVIRAYESIKNFDTGFIQPVTFSPTDHNGQRSTKLLVALPGKKWSVLAEDLVVRDKVEKIQ
jgi:branched-chain amino acid transport system substrate-binding protein